MPGSRATASRNVTCLELKTESDLVMQRLQAENADAAAIAEWNKLVH